MSSTSGITYQAVLPLRWQYEALPSDTTLSLARQSNVSLLHALTTLESVAEKDHDADPAIAKAVDRLESKLDIALTLLARIVEQQMSIPARIPVRLGVNQIEWQGTLDFPNNDSIIRVSLHLSPKLPEPLQLYARVITSQTEACVAEFLDRDAEFEEWITRTLFRYHRRALQARHQA